MTQDDATYMRLAIEEAKKGKGRTSPNPCVGAVIVRDGIVVGQGYHKKAGTPHAEINAIAVSGLDTSGATIYVTLEPCNHTGRTPPCTKAILDAGISRVVIGMSDPNPTVAGDGAEYLRSQGLDIETGIMETECRELNRPFIKHIQTGMPWIVMKAGMSMDGRISYNHGQAGRITGQKSHYCTHELRNSIDAILIGIDTAIIDNPSLTTRLEGMEDVRDPLRVILDSNLRLPPDAVMLTQQSSAETWVYCGPEAPLDKEKQLTAAGASVIRIGLTAQDRINLEEVLAHLGMHGTCSVLVEGGSAIHGSMLSHQLVDEVFLFMAPFFIGDQGNLVISGYSGQSYEVCERLQSVECIMLDDDILVHGFFHSQKNS